MCQVFRLPLRGDPADGRTKYTRRKHLEDICREPLKSGRILGDIPLRLFGQDHVMLVMDRKRAKPEASDGRRKALLAMFNWAIPRKLAKENPAALVKRLKSNNPDGYATWGTEHVERFKETHPLGTRAYLAMAMLLFTGQRRSDVIRFGRQHIKDGAFHFVQQKGERTSRTKMRIEILPALQEALDLVPKEQLKLNDPSRVGVEGGSDRGDIPLCPPCARSGHSPTAR